MLASGQAGDTSLPPARFSLRQLREVGKKHSPPDPLLTEKQKGKKRIPGPLLPVSCVSEEEERPQLRSSLHHSWFLLNWETIQKCRVQRKYSLLITSPFSRYCPLSITAVHNSCDTCGFLQSRDCLDNNSGNFHL